MAALLFFFIDRDVCFIKNYERATAEREKMLFQYFAETVCTSIPSQCLSSEHTLIKLGKPSIVNIPVLADPELFSCFRQLKYMYVNLIMLKFPRGLWGGGI